MKIGVISRHHSPEVSTAGLRCMRWGRPGNIRCRPVTRIVIDSTTPVARYRLTQFSRMEIRRVAVSIGAVAAPIAPGTCTMRGD